MKGPVVVGAILVVLGACNATEDDAHVGSTSEAIVDGTTSPASQDSALLLSDTGEGICTAVLIAPNLVLTARHCVTDYDDRTPCGGPLGPDRPADVLTVSIGAAATPRGYVARGARLFTPTGATQLCGADIALLMLDDDVKNVTPLAVRFTDPTLNELGTAVGYGDTNDLRAERTGVKILALGPSTSNYTTQNGQAIAMDLSAAEVASSESTCFGDSGGPLLDANNQVMAIASRGPDDRCRDRPTFWTSLGDHADFIKEAAAAAGHPIADAPTSTTPNGTSPTVAGTDTQTELPDGGTTTKKAGLTTTSLAGAGGCNASGGSSAFGTGLLLALALLGRRRRS